MIPVSSLYCTTNFLKSLSSESRFKRTKNTKCIFRVNITQRVSCLDAGLCALSASCCICFYTFWFWWMVLFLWFFCKTRHFFWFGASEGRPWCTGCLVVTLIKSVALVAELQTFLFAFVHLLCIYGPYAFARTRLVNKCSSWWRSFNRWC